MRTFRQFMNETYDAAPVTSNQIDVKKFNLKRYKAARVEDYELHFDQKGDRMLFAILGAEGTYIAYLLSEKIDDYPDSKPTIRIRQTWVEKPYRRKGYMAALYNTLANQGFRVMSDFGLTDESKELWRKMARSPHGWTVKVFNTVNKKVLPFSEFAFSNDALLFMLEGHLLFGKAPDNDVLIENRIYIGQDCP